MSDDKEKGLDTAIALAKKGDIQGARFALDLAKEFTDKEIVEALVSLKKGIDCLSSQRQTEALEPLRKALPVVDASRDETTKFVIHTLVNFAEGLTFLFSGDAHRAAELLNVSTEAAERIAFFIPGFEIAALDFKAISLIAVARAQMNATNIAAAEEAFGAARNIYDELLNKLDPNNKQHAIAFAEVYGTRFEMAFSFITVMDIGAMDIGMFKKRLLSCKSDVEKLKRILCELPEGPISSMMSAYPITFVALEGICRSLEIVALERRPFAKEEAQTLVRVDEKLFRARQMAETMGDRSRAFLYQIDRLRKLQQNLLLAGKAASKDFGRFGGTVSLVALIALMVVLHLTVKPTGFEAILFFMGSLILSLIVGFGFGALKFQPLLKIFSDAMRENTNKK